MQTIFVMHKAHAKPMFCITLSYKCNATIQDPVLLKKITLR